MDILDLYSIIDKENIDIYAYDWNTAKARILEVNGKYAIALDNNLIENSIDEKQVLAEELGHYYCRSFILY